MTFSLLSNTVYKFLVLFLDKRRKRINTNLYEEIYGTVI